MAKIPYTNDVINTIYSETNEYINEIMYLYKLENERRSKIDKEME